MARSVIAEISAFSPAKSASSSRHSTLMIVESMSATSRRLRRPSTGCRHQSSCWPARGASSAARTAARSSASRITSVAAPSPVDSLRDSLPRAPTLANTSRRLIEKARALGRATRVRTSSMEPRIWLIAGPTASGKSALALRLARTAGAEIVNADSMQLYRDLRLLSARPSPDEEAQAPHHLFGTADAAEGWSVGRWLRAATEILAGVASRGRPAIVVGGTGLYFHALTHGLAKIPPVPAAARHLDPDLPAMKAVGVREFAAHLRGDTTLPEALAAAQQETRRYAKRQATWMRGRMADWPRLGEIDADAQWRQFLALDPGLTA